MAMQLLNKFKCFMAQSHRWAHFLGGLVLGLVCGFDAAVAVAAAMEFKDCQYDRWNAQYGVKIWRWRWKAWSWVDFACTIAGGLVGSVLRWMAIGWFM